MTIGAALVLHFKFPVQGAERGVQGVIEHSELGTGTGVWLASPGSVLSR